MSETYNIVLRVEGEDHASGPLGNVGGALGSMGEIAGGILSAQLFSRIAEGIMSIGREALDSYASYERLGMSLQSLMARQLVNSGQVTDLAGAMGEAKIQAEGLQGWITKLAIQSPFNQDDIASSFRMAMASGFAADESKRLVTAMTDFSAGSGATGETMNRIAMGLGRIKMSGKAGGEALMMLTEAGLPVRQILANAFNVTTAELEKMIAKGLVPADKAIEAITQSLEKDFGGAAKRQASTFSGLISSLQDIKTVGLREFFASTFQEIQPYVASFVDMFSSEEFMGKLREMGAELGKAVGFVIEFVQTVKTDGIGVAFDNLKETLVGILPPELLPAFLALNNAIAFIGLHFNEFAGAVIGAGAALLASGLVPIITGIAAGIGTAIAAISWPLVALVAVSALLGAAWAGNWGDIQGKTAAVWAVLQPILQSVYDWCAVNLPLAFAAVSDFWNTTLYPAFTRMAAWLSTNIPAAIGTLSDYWKNTLLPAILIVYNFLNISVFPLFRALADFWSASFSLQLTVMAGIWQNVLMPAISSTWNWLTKTGDAIKTGLTPAFEALRPIVEAIGNFFKGVFLNSLNSNLATIGRVTDAVKDMANALRNIKLPAWMMPGSPTPWENGLVGVQKALAGVSNVSLPGLSASFAGLPSPMASSMGSYGGSSYYSGSSGAPGVSVNIYSAINTADEDKMRRVLNPIILDAVRKGRR